MEVSYAIGLDYYFHDAQYELKKPNLRGTWKERCGDNFYSRAADGRWIQYRNRFQLSDQLTRQDTRFAHAFVGFCTAAYRLLLHRRGLPL
jgi:hypothetical protein